MAQTIKEVRGSTSDHCDLDPFHLKMNIWRWLSVISERLIRFALAIAIVYWFNQQNLLGRLQDPLALKTMAAGITAAVIGLVQLNRSLPWTSMWRVGARRWTLTYVVFCGVVAGATYSVFHDKEPIKGAGEIAPILVGFFYPVIIFGMLTIAQSSITNEKESNARKDYQSLVGIFVERIRVNSRRFWDYMSQLLIHISIENVASLEEKDGELDLDSFHEDPRCRLSLLHILRTITSSPNSFDDLERLKILNDRIEKQILYAKSELSTQQQSGTTTNNNSGSGSIAEPRWNVYDVIDQFHRVCTPESLLQLIPIKAEVKFQLKDALLADLEQIAKSKNISEFGDEGFETLTEVWIDELIRAADGTSLEFFRTKHRYYAIEGKSKLRCWPNYQLRFCWHCCRWKLITSILDACRSCETLECAIQKSTTKNEEEEQKLAIQ